MLTAKEAKDARRTLGLSQKKVTEHTGISNTDISKFENGRLILPNDQMTTLVNFYLTQGATLPEEAEQAIEEHETQEVSLDDLDPENADAEEQRLLASEKQMPVRTQHRHIDGILIPDSIPPEEADALMDEYQENKERIKANLERSVPRSFFGKDLDMDEVLRNVLVPMAENFAIIDRIHGDTQLAKWETVDHHKIHKDRAIDTYQDVVEHLFTTPYTS